MRSPERSGNGRTHLLQFNGTPRSRVLSRLRRPVGRFNTELLGVLGVQSLPAAELHGLGADDASNGAHSRRCAGSVSACQTFSGEWRSSLTRMSVHFSPSFRTCAPLAGPGAYCSRSVIFFSLSSFSLVLIDPCGRGGVREQPRG